MLRLFVFLLLLFPLSSVCSAPRIPTLAHELNPFVKEWNIYVDKIQRGEVSIEQWNKVKYEWNKMVGNKNID